MKKKIIMLTSLIVFVLLAYAGFSYAIFTNSKVQEGSNSISTYNCLDVKIDGEDVINLTNAFPIKDEEGVLQTPYKFTVKNKCAQYVVVDLGIELQSNNTLDDDYIKGAINEKGFKPTIALLKDAPVENNRYKIIGDSLASNEEKEYELRVWIDYDADESISGSVFKGKVYADATILRANDIYIASYIDGAIQTTFPNSAAYGTTVECTNGSGYISWNGSAWELRTLTTTGETRCNVYFNSNTKALAKTIMAANESIIVNDESTLARRPGKAISTSEDKYLVKTLDDYGNSYIFRGNIDNNYVIFANKCWKIVRIVGDGSVKLFYWGNVTNNTCGAADNSLTNAFNNKRIVGQTNPEKDARNRTDAYTSNRPAGVGFMYGDAMGSTYAAVHANTNDSDILTVLKSWYNDTFTTAQKNALADVIWCNDKSINSGNGYDFDTTTYYNARNRIYANGTLSNAAPTLVCPNAGTDNKLSKFTASDTINGNGALNGYKIGLLTADEAAFAGGAFNIANSNYYLYTGAHYWLLSPFYFSTSDRLSIVWNVHASGCLDYNYVTNTLGVRPSVSLNSAAVVTKGTGVASDPYIIGA